MRSARLAAFAALTSLALSPSVAAADNCWLPSEAQAAQVRGLHLMLMVGTMQCAKINKDSYALLNNFVELQRDVLLTNADVLKDHFIRENGTDGWQAASDKFETSMANLYSGSLDDGGYCTSVDSFVRLASGAARHDLLLLAKTVADAPVGGVCTAADYSFRRPAAGRVDTTVAGVRVHRLPPRIALSNALPSAAPPPPLPDAPRIKSAAAIPVAPVEPAPQVATPAPAAPIIQLANVETVATPVLLAKEAAPVPVAVVAALPAEDASPVKTAAVSTGSAPTKDDALNAAVLALQSAVAALQAVSAPTKPD